jgi:spermidine/putrescine-binding protein
MNLKQLFKSPLSILLNTSILLLPTSLITSCSQSGIIFANFESYMSDKLIDKLHEQAPIRFVNYSTNEDISAKFANSYDIAVPSTYMVLELIKQGLCGKLD